MQFLYNLSIYFYWLAIRTASLFNPKAKLWINGRKDIFQQLSSRLPASAEPLVWFHCASLGEFEQGRTLIEKYKIQHPQSKILLTFFSPSGYEIRKNYAGADIIMYLPLDTPANTKRFFDLAKPTAAFFIKYEFWFNYLNGLKQRKIPTYLISGIFREEQHFFKPYGTWFRKQLSSFSHFYLQDEHSEKLLNNIGYKNTTVVGDTRFDRVSEISANVKSFPLIELFARNNEVLIAGSSWPEDEKIIVEYFKNSKLKAQYLFKIIIAPHEIDEKHISSIEMLFASSANCLRYSRANESTIVTAQILIIDNIGMLSSLYQYGTIAFIGGGFGKGIHNILEAATFGLPVIFGPNYEKFTEAKELIKTGGAFSISNENELQKTISLLQDEPVLKTASHIAKHYVESRTGVTDKILNSIGS